MPQTQHNTKEMQWISCHASLDRTGNLRRQSFDFATRNVRQGLPSPRRAVSTPGAEEVPLTCAEIACSWRLLTSSFTPLHTTGFPAHTIQWSFTSLVSSSSTLLGFTFAGWGQAYSATTASLIMCTEEKITVRFDPEVKHEPNAISGR